MVLNFVVQITIILSFKHEIIWAKVIKWYKNVQNHDMTQGPKTIKHNDEEKAKWVGLKRITLKITILFRYNEHTALHNFINKLYTLLC